MKDKKKLQQDPLDLETIDTIIKLERQYHDFLGSSIKRLDFIANPDIQFNDYSLKKRMIQFADYFRESIQQYVESSKLRFIVGREGFNKQTRFDASYFMYVGTKPLFGGEDEELMVSYGLPKKPVFKLHLIAKHDGDHDGSCWHNFYLKPYELIISENSQSEICHTARIMGSLHCWKELIQRQGIILPKTSDEYLNIQISKIEGTK